MEISFLTLGIADTNTYFIENEDSVLLVDPSSDGQEIISKLKSIGKPLKAIILTHAHFDHIGALDEVLEHYDVPVYLHKEEFNFLTEPAKNGSEKFSQYGLKPITSHAKPIALDEGKHDIEGFNVEVMHTPGHSPGGLTFIFDDFALVGDALFNNGIGRTDLYRGDYETLVDSIQDKIFTIKDDLPLYPGHGPSTTVEGEQLNPYLHG
ncbi:MBL fold metallo-hydrolase [Staphylococcus simulans]|uniref:MBL fold metallo-hydrolase n=1 Tax=Staphylococcus simulans TaxID=1286 RepID=UPI0021D1E6AF|nr:MBL fold metallo-hydrolase [Staphylococcus simulans]UXR31612.1 MBL fold metallo-hydrolase [Staphylococcus simulans]